MNTSHLSEESERVPLPETQTALTGLSPVTAEL